MNLRELIHIALDEDIPRDDITTDNLNLEDHKGHARLVAKQDLVLSGREVFETTFRELDPDTTFIWTYDDGDFIKNGEIICAIDGKLAMMLKAERTALNFLGHLSGIATLTSKFVEKTRGTKCKIVDTRKTTPALRKLEKAAVRHGGGTNHRMQLSERVLIKENHIRAVGSITAAVQQIRNRIGNKPIEVEVTNFVELDEALKNDVTQVLLDNMSNEDMARAVSQVAGRCLIEASGNMRLDRIESVAKLGVDFISVGLLTHSAPSADVSLQFAIERKP